MEFIIKFGLLTIAIVGVTILFIGVVVLAMKFLRYLFEDIL